MPAKHQPDHAFLRHVPLRRIHLFTLVQILCLAVLWILKSTMAAIIFPVMVRWARAPHPARRIGPGPASMGRSTVADGLTIRVTEASTEQDSCECRPEEQGSGVGAQAHLHLAHTLALSRMQKPFNLLALGQNGEAG